MNNEAIVFLTENWGEDAVKEILWWAEVERAEMPMEKYLTYCTACGGNWGGMLLTGLKELCPNVWDAIPDMMGANAFVCICKVLTLCGVDMGE